LINRLGDVFLLVGISLSFNYINFDFLLKNFEKISFLIIFLLILAAFTKSAQIPFSS
jgi:NADH:ubiquinone oxidoreductase subunit 5 (subunit L)/multisubunit Na+/H+ antiporter MnhA subunit